MASDDDKGRARRKVPRARTDGGSPRPHPAAAVVLAGAASSRMGQDKCFLDIRGVPLLERILRQLRGRFREVLVSAETVELAGIIRETVIPDPVAGQGPLVGISAALEAAASQTVFVVACDIPDIDHDVVGRLVAAAKKADVAVPRRADGKLEPLFSAWRRSALPAIRQVLASGKRKIDAVFPLIRLAVVEIGAAPWLWNLNGPADVAAFLEEIARREGSEKV